MEVLGVHEQINGIKQPAQAVTAPGSLLTQLNSPFYFHKATLCSEASIGYYGKSPLWSTHDSGLHNSYFVEEAAL